LLPKPIDKATNRQVLDVVGAGLSVEHYEIARYDMSIA
jgi:ferritin-like metal-binding protein YciE